jgi:transposase
VLSLPPSVRVFLCLRPTDMRRSFDGLCAMVEQLLERDPFSGHLFVFVNRRSDRVKLLYWDCDGFAIWYKRLEEGTITLHAPLPPEEEGEQEREGVEVRASDLAMLLDGIDLSSVKRRKRYKRRATATR